MVQIPLGDVYMVKILTKKELWTRYRHPWNGDLYWTKIYLGKHYWEEIIYKTKVHDLINK